MTPLATDRLAIVIPAYKRRFLARSLQSLLSQTDQRFSIYIGDDASPDDLSSLVRDTLQGREFLYKKFDTNLGERALSAHWERCIALTHEPWIWLFSDDDLMDAGCVAAFNNLIDREFGCFDVVRFDAFTIDETDRVIDLHSSPPEVESWLEFAYWGLQRQRNSFMQQVIFSRHAFERAGGFVDLPLAWGSDNAAIIAMANSKSIRKISGEKVYWRRSSSNITPAATLSFRVKKFRATCLYLHWLKEKLALPRPTLFPNDTEAFMRAMYAYMVTNLQMEGGLAGLLNLRLLLSTFSATCHTSRMGLYRQIASAVFADLLRLCASGLKVILR